MKLYESTKQALNENVTYSDEVSALAPDYNENGKTWRERGYFIAPVKPGRFAHLHNGPKLTHVFQPAEVAFKFGRPLEFTSEADANEFLDSDWFDGNIYDIDKSKLSKDGQFAIYKMGGFSGNMTDENKHAEHGWHLYNTDDEEFAKRYVLLSNMDLQWSNSGGGRVVYAVDDKSSVAAK